MPKFHETRCEVCGEKIEDLGAYSDILNDVKYKPEEYLKHQLEMSNEEKEARQRFFTEMFEGHNEQRDSE